MLPGGSASGQFRREVTGLNKLPLNNNSTPISASRPVESGYQTRTMIIRNSLSRSGSRYPVIATSYRSILGSSQSISKRNDVSSSSIHTTTRYSRPPPSTPLRRTFHSTSKRQDVFFFALPALKGALLNVTRVSLITLPFIWRWR